MVAFRLDVNEHIASGHLFRCLAIAKKCRQIGLKCIFILSGNAMTDVLTKEGFEYVVLDIKWDDYEYNIDELTELIITRGIKCLVVDSYHVSYGFFDSIRKYVKTLYMDDLCKEAFPVTVAIHHSEWEGDNTIVNCYRNTGVKVYYGTEYVPLKDGFYYDETINKDYDILITTGGSDTYHITLEIVKRIIDDKRFSDKQVCLVLGKMNTDEDTIRSIVNDSSMYTILKNISNMDEVMRKSKVAVTAGGNTVYELMSSGVLFSMFAFSDDQQIFGKRLASHSNVIYAGDARDSIDEVVSNLVSATSSLLSISEDEKIRQIMFNRKMVDGKGAVRIAEIIDSLCKG